VRGNRGRDVIRQHRGFEPIRPYNRTAQKSARALCAAKQEDLNSRVLALTRLVTEYRDERCCGHGGEEEGEGVREIGFRV